MIFTLLLQVAFLGLASVVHSSVIPPYILYGKVATQGQFPFAVYLRSAQCSASILDKRTILTAAHCICATKPEYAIVGSVTGENPEANSQRYELDTSRQKMHPDYEKLNDCEAVGNDDVAIVKTTRDIVFSSIISPITLTSTGVSVGESVTISGYGIDERWDSGVLKYATNKIAKCLSDRGDALCQSMQPNTPYAGDSGGPLFVDSGSSFRQVGIVSGGSHGANQAIYANVHSHLQWIRSNME